MGEYIVSGNDVPIFMFITLGTGVGSGLILNGKVFRGFNGAASEAGHITLFRAENRVLVENVVAGRRMLR